MSSFKKEDKTLKKQKPLDTKKIIDILKFSWGNLWTCNFKFDLNWDFCVFEVIMMLEPFKSFD